jgi:peptidoglycan/LPS O-acetylase OafA/YrhL
MLDIVIEGMRGIASCWVFIYHVGVPQHYPFLNNFAVIGLLGVPMFFVISGFCIGSSSWSSRQRGEPATAFLGRRLWRIYPPLWASILVVLILPFLMEGISSLHTGHFSLTPPRWFAYSPLDWLGIATLSRVFFSHGAAPEAAFSAFNSVYWTLAIEVQFYLMVFVILLAGKWAKAVLAAVTIASCIAACMPPAYNTGVFLPYWPLFAVGLGLFALVRSSFTPAVLWGRRHLSVSVGGVILLMLAFVLLVGNGMLDRVEAARPLATFFCFGLCFAVFLWLSLSLEPLLAQLRRSGPVFIRGLMKLILGVGAASYSIYLLHGKLWELPAMFVRQVLPANGLLFLVCSMMLTIALGCVFSIHVERRFIRMRGRPVSKTPFVDLTELAQPAVGAVTGSSNE